MQVASAEIADLEINVTTNSNQLKEFTTENWFNKIILADCGSILRQMPSDAIDLIITSPPYADSRKKTYGGIHPNNYVNWFLPISEELKRVLKPSGTFIFNIKEKVVDGERHPYVLNLILEMQKQGWLWTEEYIWPQYRTKNEERIAKGDKKRVSWKVTKQFLKPYEPD